MNVLRCEVCRVMFTPHLSDRQRKRLGYTICRVCTANHDRNMKLTNVYVTGPVEIDFNCTNMDINEVEFIGLPEV